MTPKKKKILLASLIVLIASGILLVVIAPFAVTFFRVMDKFHELGSIPTGDTAYHLAKRYVRLSSITSGNIDSVDFGGTKLINFWASWCQPCIEEVPSLQALRSKRRDIQVMLFSFDDLQSQKSIYTQKQWDLPAYLFKDTSIFPLPSILPTTYIVKDYRVVGRIMGSRDWGDDATIKMIDSLSSAVSRHKTGTLNCA